MELIGHVAGGVVVFDGNVDLPEGTRVRVTPIMEGRPRSLPERRPPGAAPGSLLRLAGAIPAADCAEMEEAINEGCGQVDVNA